MKHICLTFSGGEMTEVVVAVIEDGTQNMETGIGGTGRNPLTSSIILKLEISNLCIILIKSVIKFQIN